MFVLHDVEKVTIKRKSEPSVDGQVCAWTTLVVTHKAHGYNDAGEYVSVTSNSEITLHHQGLLKMPFRFDGRIGA